MRRMSSAGFLSALVMELYGENAYFAASLPDGFYKWQYDRLHPFKLYLSTDEVDKYWKEGVFRVTHKILKILVQGCAANPDDANSDNFFA